MVLLCLKDRQPDDEEDKQHDREFSRVHLLKQFIDELGQQMF